MSSGAGIVTQPIDISKYKCVPLDLLQNVSDQDKIQFNASTNGIDLTKFRNELVDSVVASGPSGNAANAETIENFLIYSIIAFSVVVFILLIYFLGQNYYRYGWGGIFMFSDQIRTLPVIGIASFIFLIIGFFIGFFVR
jgi:hypothetical protein